MTPNAENESDRGYPGNDRDTVSTTGLEWSGEPIYLEILQL